MSSFEDIKDASSIANRGQELLKTRRDRLSNKSVEEVRLLQKIAQDQKEIDKIMGNMELDFEQRFNQVTAMSNAMQKLKDQAKILEQGRIHGANKIFQSSVATMLGSRSTLSDISKMAGSSGMFGSAISMASSMSTADLESLSASSRRAVSVQSGRIADMTSSIEGNEWKMGLQMTARQNMMMRGAQADAALQAQRRLGLDTQSQYYNAAELTRNTIAEQQKRQIREDVSSGRAGNRKDVERELADVSTQLINSFSQLDEAIKSGSKDVDVFLKNFKHTADEMNRKQMVLSEMGRQGGGGGGGGDWLNRLTRFGEFVGNAGSITMAGVDAYRYSNVTSDIQQTQMRAGLAERANAGFYDAQSASRGDARALRRFLTGQRARENRAGLNAAMFEADSMQAQVTGQVMLGAGAGINYATDPINAAKLGATGGLNAVNYATGVAAAAAPNAAQAWNSSVNYRKNISTSQAALDMAAAQEAQNNAVNAIGDTLNQQAINFQIGMGGATRGLGRGRERTMSALMDPTALSRLQGTTGMTQEEIQRATSAGVSGLGGMFNGITDISRGGQLARSGIFQSPEQFMQARGALSDVGGSAQNLESILKNAVANGMDNSKNIMQMVEATSQLASRSASMGINVAGGAGNIIGKGVDALVGLGVDKNMAVGAAATAAGALSANMSSTKLDLATVMTQGKLRALLPGANTTELESLQSLNPAELEKLRGITDPGRFSEETKRMGVTARLNPGNFQAVSGALKDKALLSLTGVGRNLDVDKRIQAGATDDEAIRYANMYGRQRGFSGAAYLGMLREGGPNQQGIPGAPQGAFTTSAEGARGAGAQFEAKMFAESVANFKNTIGEFSKLGEIMRAATASMSPGQMAADSRQAASDMGLPTGALGGNVEKLSSHLGNAADAVKQFTSVMLQETRKMVRQEMKRVGK